MLPLKEMLLLWGLKMDGVGHFPALRFSGALRVPTMDLFLLRFVVPVLQGHGPTQDLVLQVVMQPPKRRVRFPHAFGRYERQIFSKAETPAPRKGVSAEEERC